MNGRPWTADEDETMRINYAAWPNFLIGYLLDRSPPMVHARAKKLGLKKTSAYWRNPMRHLWAWYEHPDQVKNRFKPGQVPANKGLRRPGWAPGRMAETQFKKGELTGAARHNYVPIGSTRIVYGNLERKVTDDPSIYPAKRWRPVHRMVWEAANGPVPAGHVVVFKPGQHSIVEAEITLDCLELVTRGELMSRNTIHNYPKEIVRAVQQRGALNRVIRRIQKQEKHSD